MIAKRFGCTNVSVPVIGQGTWDIPEHGSALAEAKAALRRGIELGMVHIDTAEMYGSGRVEQIVGDAIAGLDRSKLFLTTKALPSNASFRKTIEACERSLRALRTDYVDLYLLHWPSHEPIEETMRAFQKLVADGKARFVGVSNFDVEELQGAIDALAPVPMACNQVLYHLRERGIESRLVPFCRQRDIAVVAYTPFGRGRFPTERTAEGKVLSQIGRKHGKTVRQVILNFLTREPLAFTIPKASNAQHVEENAGGAGWQLDAADITAIDKAFPIRDGGRLATL